MDAHFGSVEIYLQSVDIPSKNLRLKSNHLCPRQSPLWSWFPALRRGTTEERNLGRTNINFFVNKFLIIFSEKSFASDRNCSLVLIWLQQAKLCQSNVLFIRRKNLYKEDNGDGFWNILWIGWSMIVTWSHIFLGSQSGPPCSTQSSKLRAWAWAWAWAWACIHLVVSPSLARTLLVSTSSPYL